MQDLDVPDLDLPDVDLPDIPDVGLPDLGPVAVVPLAVGAALLLFGRKLFWLAIGGVGFLVGLEVARQIPRLDPGLERALVALAFGIVGLVIAIVAQKLAVGLGGLLIGGYGTWWLLESLAVDLPRAALWGLVALGAVLGVFVAAALFELALVVLSSLAGALLVADALPVEPPLETGLFVLLAIVGIWVQSTRRVRRRRDDD